MKLLREVPITSGRPSSRSSPRRRSSSRLCSAVLPKPMPGVEPDPLLGDPGRDRGLEPLGEEGLDLVDDVVVDGVLLHRPRAAEHVHQHHRRPALGAERGHLRVAAQGGDVVDDRRAGVERRRGDRRLRGVDRDRAPRRRPAPRSPARPAAAPPPRRTASAPGRVDSPPTSRIAAPAAASSRPWAIAASGSR